MSSAPDPAALGERIAAAYGVRLDPRPYLRHVKARPESLVLAADQLALAVEDAPRLRKPPAPQRANASGVNALGREAADDEPEWQQLPPADAPALASPIDRAVALAALEQWARESAGITFDNIEIRLAPDGNRTVHARRDLVEDDLLIQVPRASLITDADVEATPLGGAVAGLGDALSSQHSQIAAWLVDERRKGPGSPWRAYLDGLPPSYGWMSGYRRAAEIAALAGTRSRDVALATLASVVNDHELVRRKARGGADLTLGDFAWGRSVAMTRMFHVTIGGLSRRALIPIADMFDHGAGDTTWGYDDALEVFVVRAGRAIKAGEEIRAIYGRFENSRFLTCYGFAIPDNPDDESVLRLPRIADPRTDLAAHLIWGLALGAPHALEVGTRFDDRFRRALSIARLRAATPRELIAAGDRGRFLRDELRWLGARLEDAALEVLADGARATLEQMRAGGRNGAHDGAWATTAAIVRNSERALLEEILGFLAAARKIVSSPSPWAFRSAAEAIAEDAIGRDRLLRGYLLATADELPR